jgi:hypothetical protein
MVSVPDWTTEGYTFQGEGDVPARPDRFSVPAFVRDLTQSLRRLMGRAQPAPPAARSMVYALCEEYRRLDLWAVYYTFRLDPRARTWQRLRRRSVPWQSDQTVEALVHRLYPWNGKGTPDANTVGLALVSAPSVPVATTKKKR